MLVKNDMRHHAIIPLMFEQGDKFRPRTRFVHVLLPKGDQTGVPVPLKRIQPAGGHCVVATIIEFKNFGSAFVDGRRDECFVPW